MVWLRKQNIPFIKKFLLNEKLGFQSNKGVKNFDEKGDNLESSPGKVKKCGRR